MSNAVLLRIAKLSEPLILKCKACPRIHSRLDVLRYRRDPASLLETLKEEFSTEELLAANVMQPSGERKPVPSPILAAFCQGFVCLQRKEEDSPYDLLTERGSLMCDDPACFEALDDEHTETCSHKFQNQLFLVSGVKTLGVMRQFHYPVTLVTGLSDLNGLQLRRLCGQPETGYYHEASGPADRADIYHRKATLFLVACDLINLNVEGPRIVMKIAEQLARLGETYGFNLDHFELWKPTESEIQDIALAVKFGDCMLIRAAIRMSLENSAHNLIDYFEEKRRPTDYAAAEHEVKEEIERARRLNHPTTELAKKRKHLVKIFEETHVRPLHKSAHSTSDPIARSLWLAAAEITVQLHSTRLLLRVAARAGSRGDDVQRDLMGPSELKERRQLHDQLIDIHRELRSKK